MDVDTLANGYETWNKVSPSKFTFKRFFDAVRVAEYRDMSVAELIAMRVDNLGMHRLVGKRSAAASYPPSDRPRGDADLDSVAYHSKPGTVSSPVLLVRTKSGLIFLDGVHRVVAANIGRQMVRVCIADLRRQNPKNK